MAAIPRSNLSMKKSRLLGYRLILVALLAAISWLGVPVSAATPSVQEDKQLMATENLPAPVAEQIAAINRGDVSQWLNLFTTDGVVNDWGRVFTGHEAIRAWSDKEFIGAKGQLTVKQSKVDGHEVTVDAGWKSDFYSGDSRFVFIVEREKVREMRITSLKD